jgi:gamma-tubulin complex component 2
MSTCTMFATFTTSLSRYLITADPDLSAHANASIASSNPANPSASTKTPVPSHRHSKSQTNQQQFVYDPQRVDKMFDILAKYEDNFARHLKILLDTLNYLAATETVVFLSLCARLSSAGEGGIVISVGGVGDGTFGG